MEGLVLTLNFLLTYPNNYCDKKKKKCDECQKELEEGQEWYYNKLRKDGKRFCSKACVKEYYKKHNKCDKCSKNIGSEDDMCFFNFNPNKDDGKLFCSQECLKEYYRVPVKYMLIGLVVIILIAGVVFPIYKKLINKKKKY